jgi:hypothetical protein
MTGENFCILLMTVVYAIFLSYMRAVDENNMDSYDRYYGVAGEGRTRGVILGTIYDAEGNVDLWRTFTNMNPHWD